MTGEAPENDGCEPPPPRENPDLIGHNEAARTLFDGARSGRLAHAWLICGPRGIGKATLAYRFARYLLANDGDAPDLLVCGGDGAPAGLFGDPSEEDEDPLRVSPDHPVFRRIASGGHADLMAIERARDMKTGNQKAEIVVNDVRGIGHFLNLTAAEGGWRVVIVDSADDMNRNAANAVLKVLEEPPSRAVLLLVSHNPGRLLPTIRSRCRKLVLSPLKDGQMRGLLGSRLPRLSNEDRAQLARLAEGSIGKAIDLAQAGGLDLYRDILGILDGLPHIDAETLHEFSGRFSRAGSEDDFRTVTELLQWWLAGVITRMAKGGALAGEGESALEHELYERMSRTGGLDRWLEVWEKVSYLLARTGPAHLDKKQVLITAFLSLENAARA